MNATTNVRKVGHMGPRKESTKARKCKFKGCKNSLRKENKNGYCAFHIGQSPKAKMRAIRAGKKNRDKNISINISREIFHPFADFCEQYGFSKKKKLELIIEEFLKLNDAQQKGDEQ